MNTDIVTHQRRLQDLDASAVGFMEGIRNQTPEKITRAYQHIQDKSICRFQIPCLTPYQQVVHVSRSLGLKHVDDAILRWRYLNAQECGKWFEARVWAPWSAKTPEVYAHFGKLGFVGNATAFTTWIGKYRPCGSYVTIPEENDPIFQQSGRRFAPCYYGDCEHDRRLLLRRVESEWGPCRIYVAFKEIHSRDVSMLT